MNVVRKNKIFFIILSFVLFIFIITPFTYGKVVYNIVNSYYLETKDFYFNSDSLDVLTKNHFINNWDGSNSYSFTINLNNRKNTYISTQSDIDYSVQYSCSSNALCVVDKSFGVIKENEYDDFLNVSLTLNEDYKIGEDVYFNISVSSLSPYSKTISAKYVFSISSNSISYKIIDKADTDYFTLRIFNNNDYYFIKKIFNNYKIDDIISSKEYDNLEDMYKKNCYSNVITIDFNPDYFYVDNSVLNNGDVFDLNVGDDSYYNHFKLYSLSQTETDIRFYKKNRSIDYSNYEDIDSIFSLTFR